MNFKNMGHFFASLSHAIVSSAQNTKSFLVAAGKAAPAVAAQVQASEPVVEAVTAAIDPRAVAIERAAYYIFGEAAAALAKLGDAAGANGVSITLDTAAIQQVKDAQAHIASIVKGEAAPATH